MQSFIRDWKKKKYDENIENRENRQRQHEIIYNQL
jgi:hypothetical protein